MMEMVADRSKGSAPAIDAEEEMFLHKAEYLTDDMMRMVADLNSQYSSMSLSETRGSGGGGGDMKEELDVFQEKILEWDSDQSMIWDRESEEGSQYLHVVDGVRQIVERLESFQLPRDDELGHELLRRAHITLQIAMARLEEEFIHLLLQNQQPLEPDDMSFRSSEDGAADCFSSGSLEEESVEGRKTQSVVGSARLEDAIMDLVHPHAVSDLKCIAHMMLLSDYDKECCQAYTSVRKIALEECSEALQMEKTSIEEIVQMDWGLLNSKIKMWNYAVKVFIRVVLSSERHLCDVVLGDYPASARESCFLDISKGPMMHLLTFGEAVAIGPPNHRKLFRVLDMYEGLADLLPDVELFFPSSSSSYVMTQSREVMSSLAESVRSNFTEFKNAIRTNTSTTPYAGGGIHPATNYVMNYIKTAADYSRTLDLLLEARQDEEGEEEGQLDSHEDKCCSPMVHHLLAVTSILERNLENRSKLYKDPALQNVFMMNNINYMVEKAKDSDLKSFLGDEWIKEHRRKVIHHATSYERSSWNSVLSHLREQGICNPGSSTPYRAVLRERFSGFNAAFEDVYRNQTAWLVPSVQLRDDLRISISLKVLQAYRTFTGRYSNHLDGARSRDRHIKYCPEDLKNYLLDLFEGSPKSLHHLSLRR